MGGAHQDRGPWDGGWGESRDGGEDPEQYCVLQKPKEKWFLRLKPARLVLQREGVWRSPAEGRCSGEGRSCGVLVQRGGHKSFANMPFLFLII